MGGKIAILNGISKGREYYFKKILTIGRNPDNDIELSSPNVSRNHARIRAGSSGDFKISDLKSNNGTFVNGKIAAEDHDLKNGDIIRIGQIEMKFEAVSDDILESKISKAKAMDPSSHPHETATGFVNIKDINLSELEKRIRE